MSSSRRLMTVRYPNDMVPNFEELYVGGVNIYTLLGNVTTNTGGSSSVTISVGEQLFVATAAGTGYVVGETIRRVEVTNTATGATTVGWYNVSRASAITVEPSGLNLRLPGEAGLTKTQLETLVIKTKEDPTSPTATALGKPDDAMSSADGSGVSTVIGVLKRVANTFKLLLDRSAELGQKERAGSMPVTLATEQEKTLSDQLIEIRELKLAIGELRKQLPGSLVGTATDPSVAVTVKNIGELVGTGTSTPGSTISLKPSEIKKYLVSVANGVDYELGDLIYRISLFDTSTTPTSVTIGWYNVTKKRGVGVGDESKLQEQVDKEIIPDLVLYYDVVKINDGSVLTVGSIASTLGGRVLGVDIYQEAGVGQIIGSNNVPWDLPTGGAYSLGRANGQAMTVLDPATKFKAAAGGIMRVAVVYMKTSSTVGGSTATYLTHNGNVLTDGAGNILTF